MDRYRLAPVRDARDRTERIRRGDLASAVGAAKTTSEDVAAGAARVERARQVLGDARASLGGTAAQHAGHERFLARLRRDLEVAIGEHERCVATHAGTLALLDHARDRLTRARADREVIERHFSRWREERKRIADRRAD